MTKAGIETTVTSDEEAMEDEMSDDAADAMDAVEDAVDAASDDEEEVEMAEGYGHDDKEAKMEALVAEYFQSDESLEQVIQFIPFTRALLCCIMTKQCFFVWSKHDNNVYYRSIPRRILFQDSWQHSPLFSA